MKSGKTYKIDNLCDRTLDAEQAQRAFDVAVGVGGDVSKTDPYVEEHQGCRYTGWTKAGPSDVTTVSVEAADVEGGARWISVSDSVIVGRDSYRVTLMIGAPSTQEVERDLDKIRVECARLLPAWARSKIQAGEP